MTEQEKTLRARFEKMAVLHANHFELSSVDLFDKLPVDLKDHFNKLKYIEVVKPLILNDRYRSGLSFRQLCIKYGVSKSHIHRIFNYTKVEAL